MSKSFEERAASAIADLALIAPDRDLVAAARAKAAPHVTPPPRRRQWLVLVPAMVAAGLLIVYWPHEAGLPPSPADAIAMATRGAAVDLSSQRTIDAGARLEPGAVVETGVSGGLTVFEPGLGMIELLANTRLRVGMDGRFTLERGVARFDLARSSTALDIAIANTEERVLVERADVGIAVASGRGSLAVFAGSVSVVGPIRYDVVTQGSMALLELAGTQGVESTLELEIEAPTRERGAVRVSGRTRPGALVTINGDNVPVNADGSFAHVLQAAGARITVHARDALGRERSRIVSLDDAPHEQRPTRERPIETRWRWER